MEGENGAYEKQLLCIQNVMMQVKMRNTKIYVDDPGINMAGHIYM